MYTYMVQFIDVSYTYRILFSDIHKSIWKNKEIILIQKVKTYIKMITWFKNGNISGFQW